MAIIDPFHKTLHQEIVQLIDERTLMLASGSAALIPEDRTTVAEKYAAACAYIAALNDVVNMAQEIEKRRYSGRLGPDDA